MAKVWLNGALIDEAEAGLSVHERGFGLGEAAFETMRYSGGEIRRWARHLARLEAGLDFLGLPIPALDALPAIAADLAVASGLKDGVLRLTVGGGTQGQGLTRVPRSPITILATLRARPTPPRTVQLARLDGVRRGAVPSNRFKLAGYADNLVARRMAAERGADMAVMLGPDGRPACCDAANLFWISAEDLIVTPAVASGALPGTARAAILDAAERAGLQIVEAGAHTPALDTAVAACVTNAVMGAVPVKAIDGRTLAVEHPGLQRLIGLEATAL